MFVFSTKLTKTKIATIVLVCACIALVVILAIPGGNATAGKTNKTILKTNEERIDYLASYGWTTENEPLETVETAIPTEFDETYEKYNSLQKEQGYDLSAYKGKTVTRYTYKITNYPNESVQDARVNMLIYENRLIGIDVSSTEIGGFMHGIDKSEATIEEIYGESTLEDSDKAGVTGDELVSDIVSEK